MLQSAQQPKPFEIEFEAIKSLDDIRRVEYQIFNVLLRDDISVPKATLCLERLREIGEEISDHEPQKESQICRKKELAKERGMFPAKLKHFYSLDAHERTIFLALNRNFNILFQEHQNQEFRTSSKTLVSQNEEINAKPPIKSSSNAVASKPRRPARTKPQSKMAQSQNTSTMAGSSIAAAPSNSSTTASPPKTSELTPLQSAPATTDEVELRLPGLTEGSFKHIPSPFSPPRKSRW